jgi:hypothetical protein
MAKASVGLPGSRNYLGAAWFDPHDAGNVRVRGRVPAWMRGK